MAHLVEQMAYVGQTPWHSLGNQLSPNQSIEVWQRQSGMNWGIKEAPVQFMDTFDDTQGRLTTFAQNKVLYRSDTLQANDVTNAYVLLATVWMQRGDAQSILLHSKKWT